ncbi:MAG: efflux RND transporter periplasmic adaptor subunit [Fusobacteriaceae bacterium]|nr:efflux RND transporter periplasmic adaptor subunit [Fusobacteriaceae bacterium]MBP6323261.1 efflux RND transporter periplasmic adaptor subunit [Fusobacteriaceae bacterium]
MKKIFILMSMVSLFVGCGKDKEKINLDLPIRPVNYVVVQDEQIYKEKEFSGNIVPEVLSELSFRVSGNIKERLVDLGEKVETGDVLAILDPTDYQLNYNRADALYRNAKSTFERDRVLYLENSISKAEYERSQADYRAKEAEANYAKQQLSYTRLVATAPGEIAKVEAEINQTVSPGQPIFTLNEIGGLEVEFTVPDLNINNMKLNQEVEIVVIATGEKVKGVISNIGSISSAYGKTYPIKAKVLNYSETIKPGMIVNLKLKLDSQEGRTVPAISVLMDESGHKYVYVVENIKDGVGSIAKRKVQLGGASTKNIEIKEGLKTGDFVVTDGATVVYEGQKVKLGEKGE